MELSINKEDLNEIEKKYDEISQFLIHNFVSFSAAAFVLNSIMIAVNNAKIELDKKIES